MKVYKCSQCGNIINMISASGVPVMCCGKKMDELVPNTVDASGEKHLPVVDATESKVDVAVGSVEHPMTEEHLIEWIAVVSDEGTERIRLKAGTEPKAVFTDKPNAEVYAYCNLHGLWKI